MKQLFSVMILIFLSGCAATALVNYNPDAYLDEEINQIAPGEVVGSYAVLGGEISALRYEGDGTRVELNRLELNQRGYPMIHNPLEGEKLVVFVPRKRLGTSYYELGNYFSATGRISAVEEATIGGEKFRIISLEAEKYNVWEANNRRFDRFNSVRGGYYGRFGSGVGFYYPYYY